MPANSDFPRVFLIRHGQTEWSQNGRHTGTTDIPLLPQGAEIVSTLGDRIVGPGRLIDPAKISAVFISPRQRAQKTFDLLFKEHRTEIVGPVQTDERAREWTYGDFEGLKPKEIQERKPGWWIWTDGCPNGESPAEVTARADSLIAQIRDIHATHLKERAAGKEHGGVGDAVVVCHGHFSRVFLARWLEFDVKEGSKFVVDAGAVSILGYQHKKLDEPSALAMNLFGDTQGE